MRRNASRSEPDLPWSRLLTEAEERFGVRRLRPGQRELIEAALRRRDVLGLLPTGAGKSLCYQLPSVVLQGVTVVVSPPIALMQDQKEKLDEAAIDAARLDSTLTATEQRETVEQIREGASEIVFVTPERPLRGRLGTDRTSSGQYQVSLDLRWRAASPRVRFTPRAGPPPDRGCWDRRPDRRGYAAPAAQGRDRPGSADPSARRLQSLRA